MNYKYNYIMPLKNEDLHLYQFNLETLKANIYCVSLWDVLKTQKLDADFCIRYILNPDFQFLEEDSKITIADVKRLQPHITDIDLIIAQDAAEKKRAKKNDARNRHQRVDSFEDFESYANRHN